MLTPTFHFKILEDFVEIFNEQSRILIAQINEALKDKNDFDIYPFITRCTLDIICGNRDWDSLRIFTINLVI